EPVLGYLKFSAKGTKSEPAPTSAPAKSQENKCKQATEITNKPAKAKRIKHSISRKTRQPRSSPKSVGASKAEEVPVEEPQVADEDADYQKALEESMKDAYALPKGPLPPVVIREPESGKYQPLPEEESEKVMLGAEDDGQDEGQAEPDPDAQAEDQTGSEAGAQAEGQAGSNPDETSKGQAGSNPNETSKGQAGPDLGDAEAKVQSISSPVVYAGSDREHMDLDVANVSPQPSTEQLDEGFTATRMWDSDSYKSHEDHMQLFEALEKSMNHDHSKELAQDLVEARKKKKKNHESPKTPPGPSKTAASAEYQAWTTTDIRLRSSISLTPADLEIDEDMAPDEQAQSSDDKDIGSAHIPTVNLRQGWWKLFEEERPTTPEPAWSIRSSDVPVPANNWALARAFNYSPPPEDSLLAQTDDITTFIDCKGRRPALSISKMKAAYYPDAGLEQMVPDQFWIEEECKYDIAA
nr:hypothetical protein [Tanacetum cinerariifolium]